MNKEIIRISDTFELSKSKLYINDVIDSNWISNTGKYISLCEEQLRKELNVKHVLLTNNGTSATHCIMKSVKYKYPQCKKIYIPDHCYVAVYNSVLYEYEKDQIVIIPIDKDTWNIDLTYVEQMEYGSCLLIVHNLGNIIPIQKIKEKRPDIIIVEDNCEGFMGKYHKYYSGTKSFASSISFYANKHITSGEGGAFITNDDDTYQYIKRFCMQGMTERRYIHDIIAYNYKYNNLSAALLYSQLQQIHLIVNKKKELFNRYKELFEPYTDIISLQKIEQNTEHSYWIFGIKIKKGFSDYKIINQYYLENGIEIRPFFYNYKSHNHLNHIHTFENYKSMNNTIILLPLHCYLKEEELKYIVDVTIKFINNN